MALRAEEARGSDHRVLFYNDDRELIGFVTAFAVDGLALGATPVLIATPDHLAALGREFGHAHLVTRDAAEVLARITTDSGSIDPGAFDREVGELLRGIVDQGGRPYAFGEMVALLWEAGNVAGALELEMLWNDLVATMGFPLLCAYPNHIIAAEHSQAFAEVCDAHSEIQGEPAIAVKRFPFELSSPRAVRSFVAETLNRWGFPEAIEDASLVATELATNAILHARGGFSIAISTRGDAVRIHAHDHSLTLPHIAAERREAAGGRGLRIIDALALEWSAQPLQSGKTVWADLRKNPPKT